MTRRVLALGPSRREWRSLCPPGRSCNARRKGNWNYRGLWATDGGLSCFCSCAPSMIEAAGVLSQPVLYTNHPLSPPQPRRGITLFAEEGPGSGKCGDGVVSTVKNQTGQEVKNGGHRPPVQHGATESSPKPKALPGPMPCIIACRNSAGSVTLRSPS